jgi:predicted small lipoprotein YifL
MKKLISLFSSSILVLSLSSCGYQGYYRYPCQEASNWDKPECNPPICEPSGSCSKDLVGKTVWEEYQKTKGANNG